MLRIDADAPPFVFYDYLKRTPLMALLLSEWPTALAASRAAPLVAVAGASGRVVLASHPAGEPTASDDGDGFDSAELALHCHTIRSVHFSGGALYSASDDEVAQWRLAHTPQDPPPRLTPQDVSDRKKAKLPPGKTCLPFPEPPTPPEVRCPDPPVAAAARARQPSRDRM